MELNSIHSLGSTASLEADDGQPEDEDVDRGLTELPGVNLRISQGQKRDRSPECPTHPEEPLPNTEQHQKAQRARLTSSAPGREINGSHRGPSPESDINILDESETRSQDDEAEKEEEEPPTKWAKVDRPHSDGWRNARERSTSRERNKATGPKRQLACPFYRRDFQKYQNCARYDLKRIKDVKQHIYRRHKQPDLYCARCFMTFDTAGTRDTHTRDDKRCSLRPYPRLEGITVDLKRQLSNYDSRGKSVEQQWYDIWDIVFPNAKDLRPQSVYIGNTVEESMPLLRLIWSTMRERIVNTVAESLEIDIKNMSLTDVIERITDTTFQVLEAAAPIYWEAESTHSDRAESSSLGRLMATMSVPESDAFMTPSCSSMGSSTTCDDWRWLPLCASPVQASGIFSDEPELLVLADSNQEFDGKWASYLFES